MCRARELIERSSVLRRRRRQRVGLVGLAWLVSWELGTLRRQEEALPTPKSVRERRSLEEYTCWVGGCVQHVCHCLFFRRVIMEWQALPRWKKVKVGARPLSLSSRGGPGSGWWGSGQCAACRMLFSTLHPTLRRLNILRLCRKRSRGAEDGQGGEVSVKTLGMAEECKCRGNTAVPASQGWSSRSVSRPAPHPFGSLHYCRARDATCCYHSPFPLHSA